MSENGVKVLLSVAVSLHIQAVAGNLTIPVSLLFQTQKRCPDLVHDGR